MSTWGLAAGLVSALVFGVAAVGQARGVRGFDVSPDDLWTFVSLSARDAGSWLVLVAYGVGFALHAVAIYLLPLYLAQTTVAMSLPVTALAAGWVEGRLPARRWVAVGLLTLGLVLVAAGAGRAGDVVTNATFGWAVLAAVTGLAAATALSRHRGGALLGLLAGLGYAGTAVAVRGVETPVTPVVLLCAVAVPVFGTLAFWVYSLGMRRAVIAAATGPMIALQTLLPAGLGIAFLDDEIRSGWWPVLIVGLGLATISAIALSRDGERLGSELAPAG
ncbi:MAG: hypothetical protein LH468_04380 [Nocardioides sp.]|nr:hypothetical protein [Nocardioides sp.]